MAVTEIELAAVSIIAVDDINIGLGMVGEHEQHLRFDFLEVAVDDDHAAGAGIEAVVVELLVVDELGREEFVQERDVVVDRTDLEDLLPPR